MKISKPRREMYKQSIRTLIASNPRVNNIEIADKVGVHRNTVTKLLEEIRVENDKWVKERWKMLINDVTEIAQLESKSLNRLWEDSYRSLYYSRPSQLVAISKANWMILKDLYRMHLEYMGVKQNPKTLVQVNVH
ncbi:MAG TPA: hypothetical protein VJC10_03690 [Patescibacteria group bacterium]|nr:hypothetical protein [Patescibacteria group bacterium]